MELGIRQNVASGRGALPRTSAAAICLLKFPWLQCGAVLIILILIVLKREHGSHRTLCITM